uniref:HECT-type E3 ubiquitin transferase n=1 Tax=Biomphalaria glabrata TaxID=6526 RepID=A0A2C9JWF4_BIOGL
MAKAERLSSAYNSVDDLSLPRGSSAASFRNELEHVQERRNSDSNLNMISPQSWSTLSVDKTLFVLRSARKSNEVSRVRVEWDIKEDVGAQDWIGLFYSGETNTSKFLDCKTRGSSGGARGAIIWNLDAIEHLFSDLKTVVCFKYISGNSGEVLATSPLITVNLFSSDLQMTSQLTTMKETKVGQGFYSVTIEDLRASNLKKGMFFNPDPYIKLQVLPHNPKDLISQHHYQKHRTSVISNSASPSWNLEKYSLTVLLTDLLEIEVKHKFSKSRPTMSRFLGRVTIPVQTIVEKISSEHSQARFNLELMRKSPSDNVSGTIEFKVSMKLLLNNQDTNSHKANSGFQRQGSLPNSLPKGEELTGHTSRVRHRHTDPGLATSDSSGMPSPGSNISEELDTSQHNSFSESFSPSEARPDNPEPGIQHGLAETDFSRLDSQLDSFDSMSATSCGDLAEGCTSSGHCRNPESFSDSLVHGSNFHVQSGSEQVKNTLLSSIEPLSSGCDSFSSELDMTVQSAELAPSLPPRTYRPAPPPLPPRGNTSAPPLPPRINNPKPGKKLPIAIPTTKNPETPPPLPPRTYSPNEAEDGSENVRKEQELFPWGIPSSPVSPNSSSAPQPRPSTHSSPTSVSSHILAGAISRPMQSVPRSGPVLATSHLAHVTSHPSQNATSRPGKDDPGSRDSIALSTTSEPAPLSSPQPSTANNIKRRSVDGFVQLKAAQSRPMLQPRQLSSEQRQQINQQLEQWTRTKKQHTGVASGMSPDEQLSSPPSFTECQAQDRLTSPRSSPPGEASNHRVTDNVDSRANGRTGASNQPPVPPSLSYCRDRSNDRGVAGDGGEPPRKRNPVLRVDDRDDALPSGWEARVDSHGRIFYIDHVNRTTTWQRPQTGFLTVQRRPTLSSEQRQNLDRRYQSIRRTMTQNNHGETGAGDSNNIEDVGPPQPPQVLHGASNVVHANTNLPSPPEPVEVTDRSVYKFPAVKFLTRPDFFPMLQVNEAAMVEYNRTNKLKHMITKIRRDPQSFERYQHNRDLVTFVNLFSDPSKELPRRWEMKHDKSGKPFFIDHVMRTTTFMDPRLPTDVPLIDPHVLPPPPPRPPPPSAPIAAIPTAYNEKVVLFLRQARIDEILRDKSPQYASSSSLREKVTKIASRGVDMLERFSNDIELTILLSLFENEIMSYVPNSIRTDPTSPQGSPVPRGPSRVPALYKRDFQAKLRNFYRKLESKGHGQGPGKLKLTVRRDHVLEDAFNKIMSTPKKELQKNKLYITFAGEEGLDYGGPSREFFFLLSRELFNPYYGLFEYSANDTYTVQISPLSTFVENAHEWFRFSGRVLGLALVHQYLLDAFFTRPFYKALLRVPLSLEDVESLDMEFHQSLLWIKDNDISEVELDLTFSVSEEVFGQVTERELKPNGKNIGVTERNKKEYIEKLVKWRLERGVTEQTESLIRGFHEVLDGRLVSVFDARELELVIAGTVEIDIADWRKNTEYRSGYHDLHQVIQWFWEAIEKFDNERQLRLLQFVTGSSSIPYEGFSALRGSNGPRKFCIEKWGKITSLPRAHTCFNRLDLPPYTSFEMLFEKLVMAVEETSTFGID